MVASRSRESRSTACTASSAATPSRSRWSKPMNDIDLTTRVLVVAPVGRDAALLGQVLAGAGVDCSPCASADELSRAIREGAAAVLLTEEGLTSSVEAALLDAALAQPAWS